jgi:hypothetical protein
MHRELVWIERQGFLGWGCSECAWVFNPSGTPTGNSLDEMKRDYEQRRDKDLQLTFAPNTLEPRTRKVKY